LPRWVMQGCCFASSKREASAATPDRIANQL
jgi:hypothetical protein